MGLKIDALGNFITTQLIDNNIRDNTGAKINIKKYSLTATADDQVSFALPFTYIEGDEVAVYADGNRYVIGVDFTITGNILTLGSGIPALDVEDTIEVVG